MSVKKVLITGSSGLIGGVLIQHLREDPAFDIYEVTSKQRPGDQIILNLSDHWDYKQLPEKVDIIIHLAQSEHFRDFPESAINVFNVNTYSTLKLLDYARIVGVEKFIYASTGGVYGSGLKSMKETDPLKLNKDHGFYTCSKACSELLVNSYCSFFNIDILRFFFVYGPKQKKTMLIPRLIDSVKSSTPIILQGLNGININPIYVEDAFVILKKCIESETSNLLNVAGPQKLSLRAIAELIGTTTKIEPVYKNIDGKPQDLVGDIDKLISFSGVPKTTFEEGIKIILEKNE